MTDIKHVPVFDDIVFVKGVEKMSPSFSPNIYEYQCERSKDSPIYFNFYAKMNKLDDRYHAEFNFTGNQYREQYCQITFPHENPKINGCSMPNAESKITIYLEPISRTKENKLPYVTYTFHFSSFELSSEERLACTHPYTRTTEGECWGGASGSSQTQMLSICNLCGTTLDTWYVQN